MDAAVEHNWFTVTTWADRDWKAALARCMPTAINPGEHPLRREQAKAELKRAREDYRRHVLSWYWKLCTPMRPGECVPNEVAALLAEEWDEETKAPEVHP